ncbi:MAG TPA: acyl-CoA dehydrogenase family protein [Ramlibacter sp.]|jgi:acyl-CoA dehydrogenase|uniref:acyl-CoA dehydrogenase family protein n=1 Tax=Ramlibacter sp. TaxID=1917967 RepID=UPI002D4948A9|nr:acyl-CoA dehydrogenase family protein [Ramlibacter sp.]HZY19060.1 acyl-CoA dehydrogenase family protein [Ramlibacter sp.]
MESHSAPAFAELIEAVRKVATEVASAHAADVDAKARFPIETLAALREVGVLAAAVPRALGGPGCNVQELAQICSTLAQACGSSAMVLAMHYIQLACLARHGMHSAFFRGYLKDLVRRQDLLASMTSEVGTFGDTRSSICAVRRSDGRFQLDKDATTGSYCAHADAILVTCRRDEDAARSDQVLVLVRREDCTLTQTTSWDTMGMRGTCSPGFKLASSGREEQILPGAFADSSAQTMVPYSHILWASLWWGIAAGAVARAASFVRGQARQTPGSVPPTAARLAQLQVQLQAARQNWLGAARDFDAVAEDRDELMGMGWALRLNNLKIAASEATPQIVHGALQIVGILGYKNDSPFSLGRHYRDALSGSLMISNERIAAKNASMLLVYKDAA